VGVEWTVIAQRYTGPATSRNVYGTVPTDAHDVNALPDRSPGTLHADVPAVVDRSLQPTLAGVWLRDGRESSQ